MTGVSPDIALTLKALKGNHFDARFVPTVAEAKAMVLEMIPLTSRVGIGDSVTLRQMGVIDELVRRGNKVINPFTLELTGGPAKSRLFIRTCRKTFSTDVFITGSNAVTEDGKIVSIDYAGNRVAGIIYGAEKVILLAGRNKIIKD